MLVNKASCTSFFFPLHILIQLRLSNQYTQMYGTLLLHSLMKDKDITSLLWMILLDIFGSSLFSKSLMLFVVTMFLQFNKMVATQFCASIKCLQIDWGSEYRKFQSLLHDLGIGFKHPCPHTHQQNGKIEPKH